jgi:hypothetical protein
VALVAPVVVAWKFPGEEVTVYPVMDAPPFEEGAVQLTLAWALPAVAVTAVGAPGTVGPLLTGTTALVEPLDGPVPTLLLAATVKE